MKKSSAASAAASACDHMHDWWFGTVKNKGIVSMGVIPDKNYYGIDQDLCYSYPCECYNGEWRIVEGLNINDFSKEKMKKNETEL